MLISLCIPAMNRAHDLRKCLPAVIGSANFSPPVEIVIVDYSSRDGLPQYLAQTRAELALVDGNFWTARSLNGKHFYNSAHARNLCVMASHGDYIVQLGTDILPDKYFVAYIRERISQHHPVWMNEGNGEEAGHHPGFLGSILVCKRDEFIAAGGYDERFKYYGPEDRDICHRLHRRGGKFEAFPSSLVKSIPTPYREKLRNLDKTPFTDKAVDMRRQMSRYLRAIYEENKAKGVLVANEGTDWGKWE